MSAGAFNALTDGYVTSPDPGPPPTDDNGGATMGARMGPFPNAANVQGTPPIFGAHNIPLHVAFLGLIALGVVWALHWMGFGFSVAGRIAAGRG